MTDSLSRIARRATPAFALALVGGAACLGGCTQYSTQRASIEHHEVLVRPSDRPGTVAVAAGDVPVSSARD